MGHPLKKLRSSSAGITLIEVAVSLAITGLFVGMVLQGIISTIRGTTDHEIKSATLEQARSLLDLMVYDLRVAGSGIPFSQSGFKIGGTGLGDAPLPILTSSSASKLDIRINERGHDTILTANYTPSSSALAIPLFSTADFAVNDTIYISDMTVGGGSGLKGTVTGKSSTTVTIGSTYIATASATFPSGSIANRVTTVNYDSPSTWSGVTRAAEATPLLLQENSTFTVTYRDVNGNTLAVPMTEAQIRDSLASVILTVSVRSDRKLRSGVFHTAQARQEVSLRNLILSR